MCCRCTQRRWSFKKRFSKRGARCGTFTRNYSTCSRFFFICLLLRVLFEYFLNSYHNPFPSFKKTFLLKNSRRLFFAALCVFAVAARLMHVDVVQRNNFSIVVSRGHSSVYRSFISLIKLSNHTQTLMSITSIFSVRARGDDVLSACFSDT